MLTQNAATATILPPVAAPQSASAAPPLPVRGPNREPALVNQVLPQYPRLAIENRVSGDVDLEVLIDATGRVTKAIAVAGPVTLRTAAQAAVMQWRYEPAMASGVVVGVRRRVRVSFR
jgi:TonB family protein